MSAKEHAMDIKRLLIATAVSTTTLFITGYALFGVLLPGFSSGFMNAGSAIGVARRPLLWWAIALGMLSYGLLIAVVVDGKAGPITVRAGVFAGATVSFLMWLTADLMLYGLANVGTVAGVVTDALLETVPAAIASGAVATVFANLSGSQSLGKRAA